MFHYLYVDNWESTLTDTPQYYGIQLYLPPADIALLPDIAADGGAGIPLVLEDGNGNYERVVAYNKTSTYLSVARDYWHHGYKPVWPIGTKISCRPFAEIMNTMQNSFHVAHKWTPANASFSFSPWRPEYRSEQVTLTQDTTISFDAVTISAWLVERIGRFTAIIKQDATGGHLVTWGVSGATLLWDGGVAPTLDTTANSYSIIEFYGVDANTWIGKLLVTGAV